MNTITVLNRNNNESHEPPLTNKGVSYEKQNRQIG